MSTDPPGADSEPRAPPTRRPRPRTRRCQSRRPVALGRARADAPDQHPEQRQRPGPPRCTTGPRGAAHDAAEVTRAGPAPARRAGEVDVRQRGQQLAPAGAAPCITSASVCPSGTPPRIRARAGHRSAEQDRDQRGPARPATATAAEGRRRTTRMPSPAAISATTRSPSRRRWWPDRRRPARPGRARRRRRRPPDAGAGRFMPAPPGRRRSQGAGSSSRSAGSAAARPGPLPVVAHDPSARTSSRVTSRAEPERTRRRGPSAGRRPVTTTSQLVCGASRIACRAACTGSESELDPAAARRGRRRARARSPRASPHSIDRSTPSRSGAGGDRGRRRDGGLEVLGVGVGVPRCRR